jgi:uncharacterized protein (TIGR03437 family)
MLAVLLLLLAVLVFGPAVRAETCRAQAPCYVASSIVNAASNLNQGLAANTFVTIYGKDLAYSTRALAGGDVKGDTLPSGLGGVTVRIGSYNAPLFYVSPQQVNLLLPNNLVTGKYEVVLVRDGVAGPPITINLAPYAPALFQLDENTVVATHADGSLISPDSPARPGEIIILYATGLGKLAGRKYSIHEIPSTPQWIEARDSFGVLLNGKAVEKPLIHYAGVAPGFAGLYQVNLQLPADAPANPEISLEVGGHRSPTGLRLNLN